jgi:MFS family permease
MAYGFSVFWLPLSKAIGITDSVACPADMGFVARALSTTCDWKLNMLGWTYTLFFVFLGSAAAIWGGWLERAGPRKAGVVAAFCWCGGLVISAGGVVLHQLWMLWLGSGIIGGIGLGLGYISPVSTLIKWFPDRRGMATGMAIMGFGGGAMIGAPLADRLMKFYATPASVGVWETFLTLAAVYFVFMMAGALSYRVPPDGWRPANFDPTQVKTKKLVTDKHVHLNVAWRTPQFWLLWGVLTLNVSAGIGILGMASPLLQEVFGGRLIGVAATFDQLTPAQKTQIAAIAAGFTGLLSLFNIGGRIFWASLSDRLGRKATYAVFFLLGIGLYASIPWTAATVNLALFVAFFCVALSMYGGGFATVPAYLADLFGTRMVGAIHGRLLTAWSTAGVLGPVLVNYIRDYQLDHGVAKAQAYSLTMFILAGLLGLGFICNLLIKPVDPKNHMTPLQIAADDKLLKAQNGSEPAAPASSGAGEAQATWLIPAAWLAVWIPLGWGVWVTLQKAVVLFK